MGQQLRRRMRRWPKARSASRLFDEAPIAYVHEGLDFRFIPRTAPGDEDSESSRKKSREPTESRSSPTRGRPNSDCARRSNPSTGDGTSGVVLDAFAAMTAQSRFGFSGGPGPTARHFHAHEFVDITGPVADGAGAAGPSPERYLREEIALNTTSAKSRKARRCSSVAAGRPGRYHGFDLLIIGDTAVPARSFLLAPSRSQRAQGPPLVKMNCAAISAGLVESELFGHVKVFTARTNRDGRFKVADGAPFSSTRSASCRSRPGQAAAVLQEQEFEPVAATKSIRVDVRVIAARQSRSQEGSPGSASARPLLSADVFPLECPAARTRRSDIASGECSFSRGLLTAIGQESDLGSRRDHGASDSLMDGGKHPRAPERSSSAPLWLPA